MQGHFKSNYLTGGTNLIMTYPSQLGIFELKESQGLHEVLLKAFRLDW